LGYLRLGAANADELVPVGLKFRRSDIQLLLQADDFSKLLRRVQL
jgi:hypothetical protein